MNIKNLLGTAITGVMMTFLVLTPASAEKVDHQRQQFVLQLKGIAQPRPCTIPITPQGTTLADCYDVDLIDLQTGHIIGTATDAIADMAPSGTGFTVTNTTYFNLPQGTIVARGVVTLQPTLVPTPGVSVITGAFPQLGEYNILSGTGRFKNATGISRLSGGADMSIPGQVGFDCIFVLDVELGP
jgi:hypothetical protein